MKFIIKHEISGRIRIHFSATRMTCQEADILLYYLERLSFVDSAKVCERTADAVICYTGKQEELLRALCHYGQERVEIPESAAFHSGRELKCVKVLCRRQGGTSGRPAGVLYTCRNRIDLASYEEHHKSAGLT